jgi:hypothetical protein
MMKFSVVLTTILSLLATTNVVSSEVSFGSVICALHLSFSWVNDDFPSLPLTHFVLVCQKYFLFLPVTFENRWKVICVEETSTSMTLIGN